jgi:hypothetical protein
VVGDPGAAPHWVRALLQILHQTFQEMGTAEDTSRARTLSFWFTQGGYRFGNETKTFWYRSQISLVENRLFQFCPESALLGEISPSIRQIREKINRFFVSFLLDIGSLWTVCSFTVLTLLRMEFFFLSHSTVPVSSQTYIFMINIVLYACTVDSFFFKKPRVIPKMYLFLLVKNDRFK